MDFKERHTENQECHPIQLMDVIATLDAHDIQDLEALSLLLSYNDQCIAEADAQVGIDPSHESANRANCEAELKLIKIYAATQKYQGKALELCEQLLEAIWNTSAQDLEGDIEAIRELIKARI